MKIADPPGLNSAATSRMKVSESCNLSRHHFASGRGSMTLREVPLNGFEVKAIPSTASTIKFVSGRKSVLLKSDAQILAQSPASDFDKLMLSWTVALPSW